MNAAAPVILTVTLNPAIDHLVALSELVPGSVHRARSSSREAGGKGVNVAGCLSDWRQTHEPAIVATGFLGEFNAPVFEEFFAAKGIEDRFVRMPGHTRTNIKITDDSGDTTDINLPGLTPAEAHLAAFRQILEERAPGNIIVLSGSLPPGLPHDTYRQLVGRLNQLGARVILDTSGAPFREALSGPAASLPWAIKPNQHELEELTGQRFATLGQMIEAAQALVERGVGLVVVSRGEEGALFVSARHVLLGRPPVMQIASTVGAGDALVAGLVAALAEGKVEPERVARLALSFAAAKLAQRGPNLPDRDAVLTQLDTMEIEFLQAPVAGA